MHESADDAWRAAVARGASATPGGVDGRPDAFTDALAALVAEEKERLKAALTGEVSGAPTRGGERDAFAAALEALRFELAELRGRVESLQTSIDALAARRER